MGSMTSAAVPAAWPPELIEEPAKALRQLSCPDSLEPELLLLARCVMHACRTEGCSVSTVPNQTVVTERPAVPNRAAEAGPLGGPAAQRLLVQVILLWLLWLVLW